MTVALHFTELLQDVEKLKSFHNITPVKMDKVRLVNDLVGRIDQKEISAIIKKLEREGTAVEVDIRIRLNTPDSVDEIDEHYPGYRRARIGCFHDRQLEVVGVKGVDPRYRHDLNLVEGTYPNLTELDLKIEQLNVFYSYHIQGGDIEKAAELIKKKWRSFQLVYPLVSHLHCPDREVHSGGKRIDTSWPSIYEVSSLLDKNGLTHLQHNIVAKPSGLYDAGSELSGSSPEPGIKIADIALKLL